MTDQSITGLSIEISSKQTKQCDNTKYDIMFVQKLKNGVIQGWHLDFLHRYTDNVNFETQEFGKKFSFEDCERFYSHIRYLIDRSAYSYIDIYVRGYKGGQRVDARKHIKNDKSTISNQKKEYIIELIGIYFSDLSLLKKTIEESNQLGEEINEKTTDVQKKIIDDMQMKMETMSRLYEDMASKVGSENMSVISDLTVGGEGSSKKKRRKRFLFI